MSEAQSSELILLEPPDGIVFVQRDIDRSSRPTLDQPDLHVERIGMDLQDGRAGRRRDVDPELLVQLPSKRRAGKLSRFDMSTGQVPHVGVPTALGRSVAQQHPVAVTQEGRDDPSPSSA
jgi:hypothetical protein